MLIAAAVSAGCGAGTASEEAGKEADTSVTAPARARSTEQMARRLEKIAREVNANPRENLYANEARAARLGQRVPPRHPQARAQHKANFGKELLRAGKNEQAVQQFRDVLEMVNQSPGAPASYRLAVKDYLAISAMRLGETQNCMATLSPDRCIFPLKVGGVHEKKKGAREAIAQYTDILEAEPGDLNARWLLNVAYMAAGAYPEGVPEAWRIPEEVLASEYDLGRFRDVAIPLGVDTRGRSGGAVMEDLSGDGHLDLMASSWGVRDTLRYYESTGEGGFREQTKAAGLEGLVGGLNLVHADYNNDGHTDVLVLRGAWRPRGYPNSLLRNDGDGTFTDVTEEAGLLEAHPTQTAAWADYNGDGHLDLYIGNESSTNRGQNPWAPRGAGVHPGELYRNNGDGTFADVAAQAGVDVESYVKAVVWGDYNNDGRPDLYVSSWDAPNQLFRNEGPDASGVWRFAKVGAEAGVREPVESFPAWFWDYNNDGWLDLFVSGWRASAGDVAAEYLGRPHDAARPRLYRNEGDGTFEDVTAEARLDRRVLFSMGANYGDFDNDGWLDFYVGTGDPDFRSLMPSRAFRNAEGKFFQDVTQSSGLGHLQKGHGAAFGDFDNDGDQDLYAIMGGAFEGDVAHNALFENPGHGNHWITLRLAGTTSNRSAIGARIRVVLETEAGTRSVHRTVSTGGSFGSSSLQQEIGLGQAEAIRAIEVRWPATGRTQRFENVGMNQVVCVREGSTAVEPLPQKRSALPGSTGGQVGASGGPPPSEARAQESLRQRERC